MVETLQMLRNFNTSAPPATLRKVELVTLFAYLATTIKPCNYKSTLRGIEMLIPSGQTEGQLMTEQYEAVFEESTRMSLDIFFPWLIKQHPTMTARDLLRIVETK